MVKLKEVLPSASVSKSGKKKAVSLKFVRSLIGSFIGFLGEDIISWSSFISSSLITFGGVNCT